MFESIEVGGFLSVPIWRPALVPMNVLPPGFWELQASRMFSYWHVGGGV